MFNPMDFFPNFVSSQTGSPRSLNTEIVPNAGNFQEYTYELEWMEQHLSDHRHGHCLLVSLAAQRSINHKYPYYEMGQSLDSNHHFNINPYH